MTTPTEQAERRTACPECGADATTQSLAEHSLSDVGYLHDDQKYECSECGEEYTHGVPVGKFDLDATDLWCDVCDLGFKRVHRTQKQKDGVKLHLKCHHHHDFACPHCHDEVACDGINRRPSGALLCPHCDREVDREAIPFCFNFSYAHRSADSGYRAMTGFPSITGNTEHAGSPYGYRTDDDGKPDQRGTSPVSDE